MGKSLMKMAASTELIPTSPHSKETSGGSGDAEAGGKSNTNLTDLLEETDEGEVEVTVTRGQRLAVMKYNLECLLKETRDLKRVLVMEENNNDI